MPMCCSTSLDYHQIRKYNIEFQLRILNLKLYVFKNDLRVLFSVPFWIQYHTSLCIAS